MMETKIEGLKKQLQEMQARHKAAMSYRWGNYINCVDDYAVGGIQYKAEKEAEERLKAAIRVLSQQQKNGGYLEKEVVTVQLYDLRHGTFITDKVVNTKYGRAFLYHFERTPMWVSIAKRQSTYSKKGYQLRVKKYRFKAVFSGTWNTSFLNRNLQLLDVEETTPKVLPEAWDNNDLNLWIYKKQIQKN